MALEAGQRSIKRGVPRKKKTESAASRLDPGDRFVSAYLAGKRREERNRIHPALEP